jgi:hypothetical protein
VKKSRLNGGLDPTELSRRGDPPAALLYVSGHFFLNARIL